MKRRTISWPVLWAAGACTALAAAGVYFLHSWQVGRLSQTLLGRAASEESNEAWHKAANLLDHYLRLRPGDPLIRARLASTYNRGAVTLEERERAVTLHYRALASQQEVVSQAAPDQQVALRAELANLLLQVGRLVEAEREAGQVLKDCETAQQEGSGAVASNGEVGELLRPSCEKASRVYALARYVQWTFGQLSSQELEELDLLGNIELALKRNPGDLALSEAAATIYRQYPDLVKAENDEVDYVALTEGERFQKADAVLDKAIELNPQDPKAYLTRHAYRTRIAINEYKENKDTRKKALALAEEDVEQAIKLAPTDSQALLLAGTHFYRVATLALRHDGATKADLRPQFTRAKELFERVTELDETFSNAEPYLRLGDTLVQLGDVEQALAIWQHSVQRFRQPTAIVLFQSRLADHLLQAGRATEAKGPLEAADVILAELGGTIPRNDHLVLLQAQALRRARFHLLNGKYADAVSDLELAIARQPKLQADPEVSSNAWDLLGRAYGGLEDWTAAATAFDRASNFDPTASGPRLAAAQAWLVCGRLELAIDRAEQVLVVEGVPEAWVILGTAELQRQALIAPMERKWERVEESLDALSKQDVRESMQAPWRADFLRADYVLLRAQTADNPEQGRSAAIRVLKEAEARYQNREFWFEVCLAYDRLESPAESQRALEQLGQVPGAAMDVALAAARRAAGREDFSEAIRIVEQAKLTAPPAARTRLQEELLRIAQWRQDVPQLRSLLEAELRHRPSDVSVLCRLAELDQRDGNWKALSELEAKLAAAGPLGQLWARYFRIIRLYSSASGPSDSQLALAISEQSQLATLRPNWPESYALRGAIEQRLGHIEQAAAAYEQAVELGDKRYGVFEQLIGCLDQLPDQSAKVEKYLSRLEGYLPNSRRLTEIASRRELEAVQPMRAIEIARKTVEHRPDDLSARLWLGRLLLMAGKRPEALALFEQATREAADDVRSWQGLFDFHVRGGDKEQARATLENLSKNAKLPPVDLELALARGWTRLRNARQAMLHLEAAIVLAPERADLHFELARACAEEDRDQAKRCLRTALKLDPGLAAARHMLAALLLSVGGSDEEQAEAESLLSGSPANAVMDRRVNAMLLAQHGGDRGMDRAIQILEQLVAEQTANKNDRLLLAQFLERKAAATPDLKPAETLLNRARRQLEYVAGSTTAKPGDLSALIRFLLRYEYKTDASQWLDKLEKMAGPKTVGEEAALAQLIELRLLHGSVKECAALVERLEELDHDPLRPLIARVKYLNASGNEEAIETTLEQRAAELFKAAVDKIERIRIARAVGDLYATLNRLTGAERWYRVVVEEDREQYSSLALTLLRQGKPREAILLCQSATDQDKTSRPAVILTSVLLQAGGKPEYTALAEPQLQAALAKFPDDVNLLYGVGMLRILEDRYSDATSLLGQVIEHSPHHVSALNNLAVVVAETPERQEEALDLIERAIAVKGHEPTLLDTKGAILAARGNIDEAIPLLEAASRGPTADPRHRFHLALVYHEQGEKSKAREQFEAALNKDLEAQILTPTDRKLITWLKSLFMGRVL